MPSPYSPPDVIVEQYQRTRTTPRLVPQLPVAVVGPARQIVSRGLAGTYQAGEEFQARLPELAAGAVVDSSSIEVLLRAVDGGGSVVGLFQLDSSDAQLLADGETLSIGSTLALEYSLLSARNNNQPDDLTDDDSAEGTPNAVWFTDEDVDFIGRGASVSGDSFVVISAPASMAGRYRIVDIVPTGNAVNTVKLLKVDDANVPELQATNEILAGSHPTSRVVFGFPASHFLSTVPGGSFSNNVASPGLGIGVHSVIGTALSGADLTALFAAGPISIPDEDSGEAVWFSPVDPGNPATLTGRNVLAWRSLLAQVEVGDWVRFTGDFGGVASEIRDFEVVGVDLDDYEIQIRNSDLTSTGSMTPDGANDLTSIQFLRVIRGRSHRANAAGDVLSGVAQGIPFDIEVLRATPGYIELVSLLPALSGTVNTAVSLTRGIPFRNTDAAYDLVLRTTDNYSGSVLVSYRADRTDLSLNGPIEIGSLEDIKAQIGMVHPDNPLALACDMVLRSGLTDGSRVFRAYATNGPTISDFRAVLPYLEMEDDYFIVPISTDKTIFDMFVAHVDAQSMPENKHERVVLGSLPLALVDEVIPATTGDINPLTPSRVSTASPGDIDWAAVKPGMMLKVLAGSAVAEERRIKSVNSGLGYAEVLTPFVTTGAVSFKIDTYPRTTGEQAEYWRDQAKAYANKRVMLIRPDEVTIRYTDETGGRPQDVSVRVPGYYAAAAFAGLSAAMPPQAPLTNVPVPGIEQLHRSNGYFTPDQLNTIAEGGNNILIQPSRGASPYSRHQLTTDASTLETREWSIRKIVDFSAKFFRESLRPYIGKHNITEELLAQLRGTAEAILRALKESNVLLADTQLVKLYQDPDQPDSVIVEVSLAVPYPCNRIVVKLYI